MRRKSCGKWYLNVLLDFYVIFEWFDNDRLVFEIWRLMPVKRDAYFGIVSRHSSRVALTLSMDTSESKRASILALHLHTEMTQREISEAVEVSKSTVNRIIKRFDDTGNSGPLRKGKCGRKRKTTARTDKKLVRRSLANPRMTAVDLKKEENLTISRETIGRRLREAGRKARRPLKRPLLTKKMRSSRLKWAKAHHSWGPEDWKKVRRYNVC